MANDFLSSLWKKLSNMHEFAGEREREKKKTAVA
jgi:hypothetical protein